MIKKEEKSYRLGSGDLLISTDEGKSYTNLGLLKDVKLSVSKKIIERKADNGELPPKIKADEAILSAVIHKIKLEDVSALNQITELTSVTGTKKTKENEVLGSVKENTSYKLEYKNGNNTKVGNVVIKSGSTLLTENTDYRTELRENGFTYIFFLANKTNVKVESYEYTPLARKELIFKAIAKSIDLYNFKFETLDDDGKLFGVEFFKAYNKGNLEFSFNSDESSDDMGGYAIEIKATPNSNKNLFKIFDEQDV